MGHSMFHVLQKPNLNSIKQICLVSVSKVSHYVPISYFPEYKYGEEAKGTTSSTDHTQWLFLYS